MAGGIMQLVAYGVQDVYLTGNPQITYFKIVYKRHTNFAIEPIEQSFSGTADFGKSSVTSLIARNGDLMTKVYLKANVVLRRLNNASGNFAFVRRLGHAMIKEVEIQIGGSRIDRQLGEWMNIWHELSHSTAQEKGYAEMIGDTPELTELTPNDKSATLYIPLYFWFNRNNGLALPLIALQYHDVRINFNFQSADKLIIQDNYPALQVQAQITDAILIIDYVFLDSEERKRFATNAHEYLIEQLQTPDEDSITDQNRKIRLPFNHPCKEVVWAMKLGKYITGEQFVAYHPTDFELVQKKFATFLYLMSLEVVNQSGSFFVQTTDASATDFATLSSGNAAIDALIEQLRNSASLLTTQGQVEGTVNSELNYALPAIFSTDPLSVVEWLNDSWKAVSKDLISTPVSVLASSSVLTNLINQNSALYNAISPSFVRVFQPGNFGLYLDDTTNLTLEANIQLNGQDRFSKRDGNYFNYVQPWQYHTNTPADGINLFSFALNPEEHQPSGTINFSRIDFSQLNLKITDEAKTVLGDSSVITIYTTNYNILRIMGGMGGLAYSNLKSAQTTFEGVQAW